MKTSAYDLEERTARLREGIIEFCLTPPFSPVTSPIITQLVAAGTSVGANYSEADEAESKKDFRHKVAICRKESKETKYWLRMVAKGAPAQKSSARELWNEAKELHLIFCAIIRTTDQNLRKERQAQRPTTDEPV